MKRMLMMAASFAAAAGLFAGCSDENNDVKAYEAPVITLEGADIDQPQEITEQMSVKVNVTAEASVEAFTVSISSPALTEPVLSLVGLSTSLDLVNPGSHAEALREFGFPTGDAVKGKTAVSFDISSLVPMIALIYQETSDHKFTLTVTDTKGQRTQKTLTCHLTKIPDPEVSYAAGSADLWANTADLTVAHLPEGAVVQYRVKGDEAWHDAAAVDGATCRIAPVWSESANAAGLTVCSIAEGTGVFAGKTYEVRVAKDGVTLASAEFETGAGDVIPNGAMSDWSTILLGSEAQPIQTPYPNREGENFWGANSSMMSQQFALAFGGAGTCYGRDGVANLRAVDVSAMGMGYYPGTLFTGSYTGDGLSSNASSYGQPYTYTARPRALKVRCRAQVGTVDVVGAHDSEGRKDLLDGASISVAVVNWEAPNVVAFGPSQPTVGAWDPAKASSIEEVGTILGYAQHGFEASTDGMVELTLPLVWYDKTAGNPSSAPFSLVIRASVNERADFLTGCSKNELDIDSFEWVY